MILLCVVEALKEKIQWFLDNREKISAMGAAARNIGEKYTWDFYEQNVVSALNNILEKS